MFAQLKILIALIQNLMQTLLHENEQLRKEYNKLIIENKELKNKLDNKETI